MKFEKILLGALAVTFSMIVIILIYALTQVGHAGGEGYYRIMASNGVAPLTYSRSEWACNVLDYGDANTMTVKCFSEKEIFYIQATEFSEVKGDK